MADKIITIGQVSGGNYVPDTSITTPKIVQVEDPGVVINYTHIGNGRYKNLTNVPDGTYKFYDGITELPNVLGANGEWIGDSSLPYVGKTGDEDVNGVKTFKDGAFSEVAPPSTKALCNKTYVDAGDAAAQAAAIAYTDLQINNLPALMLPQSPRMVRFWEGATTVTGKIYGVLLTAVNYFNLSSNQYAVISIEGIVADIYKAPAGVLAKSTTISNLIFRSLCKEWGIAFADGVVNKNITLDNMKIFLGAGLSGGYAGATRQYTGLKFQNCDIYCFNNLSLYDGSYDNVNFYIASGKTLSFFNGAIMKNVKANTAVTLDSGFNGIADYEDELGDAFIPGGAMPADPTVAT